MKQTLAEDSTLSKPLDKLTPEEKRIRIAELCGWSRNKYNWFFFSHRDGGSADKLSVNVHQLPDYLNDLNAMHEAEKVLAETNGRNPSSRPDDHSPLRYYHRLLEVASGKKHASFSPFDYFRLLHATAAQRADAFLLTLSE